MRGYERTDRLNELLVRILAEEVERLDDDRLGLITITGVETDRDLSRARVFVIAEVPDEELVDLLEEHRAITGMKNLYKNKAGKGKRRIHVLWTLLSIACS